MTNSTTKSLAHSDKGAEASTGECLRDFNAIHIDKDYTEGLPGIHENELFFNCKFRNLKDLTLKNCDLNKSEFLTEDIREALGFTVTLDCFSFKDVKYSDLLFDLFLVLAIKSASDPAKRQKLVDLVGHKRVKEILLAIARLE
jgi:hypothetical protein